MQRILKLRTRGKVLIPVLITRRRLLSLAAGKPDTLNIPVKLLPCSVSASQLIEAKTEQQCRCLLLESLRCISSLKKKQLPRAVCTVGAVWSNPTSNTDPLMPPLKHPHRTQTQLQVLKIFTTEEKQQVFDWVFPHTSSVNCQLIVLKEKSWHSSSDSCWWELSLPWYDYCIQEVVLLWKLYSYVYYLSF